MMNAPTASDQYWPQSRLTTSVGELIAAIYDVALEELDDPELAMKATDAAVTDMLRRTFEPLVGVEEPDA